MPKTGGSCRPPYWPNVESRAAREVPGHLGQGGWSRGLGALLPGCLPPSSAGVYVFPAAWLGSEAMKGEVTTWLQPLLKANRVLTACQAH